MTRGLHWFRNDLRLRDNTALCALVAGVEEWLPVFVLDPRLLAGDTPRVHFLLDCLERLQRDLAKRHVPLLVREGLPTAVLPRLMDETGARLVAFNEDTTPFAADRDANVSAAIEAAGGQVLVRKDHVVFSSKEVRKGDDRPYSVYTPYRNAWWKRWNEAPVVPARIPRLPPAIPGFSADRVPRSGKLVAGAEAGELPSGGEAAAKRRLAQFLTGAVGRYAEDRDYPGIDGTSRLSPYLRFGAISPRQCFASARKAVAAQSDLAVGAQKWLDELVWREFYAAILEEHPRVLRSNYQQQYDALEWNCDPVGFEAWCHGRTGFPIVDAGMRQLRATGWMHNRLRMIVASFLTKDLLIDWREGERYFFSRLVDGDPASNNGGWQWAASTGTDAQPYFRIFNPITQSRRFDPRGVFLRRWVPELSHLSDREVHDPWSAGARVDYPPPIVDHAERRKLALARFGEARRKVGLR